MLWPMLQNSMYTNDWLYIREGIILPKYSIYVDHFDLKYPDVLCHVLLPHYSIV